MMIDNAISEVYKQDKKVFIPEFGAIIYSEFNDSIDFNELLNFDDGKIIAAIQKQEQLDEEASRNALEEYVGQLQGNLEEKGTHFIGGIGYITKDEDGSLSISAQKPTTGSTITEENIVSPIEDKNETDAEADGNDEKDVNKEQEKDSSETTMEEETAIAIEEEAANTIEEEEPIEEELIAEMEDEAEEPIAEELSETDENQEEQEDQEELIEPDYSYEANNDEYNHEYEEEPENEPGEKSKKPILIAIGIIILLAVMAVPAYFFIIKTDQGENSKKEKVITESPAKAEQEKEEPDQEVVMEDKQESIESAEKEVNLTQSQETSTSQITSKTNDSEVKGDKTYSLILGSFKIETNANNFETHLNNKGIEVNKFRRTNSFYFVGIESIPGKLNAVELLDKMRSEEEPTAWIIRKL